MKLQLPKNKQVRFSLFGSALGLLALLVLLIGWWRGYHYGVWGRLAALLCAALFALLGLCFMPRWAQFWSDEPLPAAPCAGEPRRMTRKLFFALLGFVPVIWLLAWLLRCAMGQPQGLLPSMSFWTCADSRHYLDIANDWYLSEGRPDRLVQLVFLPGFPLAVRLLRLLTGDTLAAGLLCSALCFAGAGCVLYRLLRLDLPHVTALRAVLFACLLPGSFFYAAPMSESLFLLSSLGCVYLARRGRWLPSCLCGAWAAFTRSLGLMLLAPLVLELVAEALRANKKLPLKKTLLRAATLLLVPLGFASYCLVNYLVSGNPFQFMIYQAEHWGQHLGLFFNTAAYQAELALSSWAEKPHNTLGLWLPNLLYLFSAPLLIALAARRLRASYTAWFIAYYLVAVGATWLLSAPRYLMAMPVLPLALALLTEKPRGKTAALVTLSMLWVLYFIPFLLRWQVW